MAANCVEFEGQIPECMSNLHDKWSHYSAMMHFLALRNMVADVSMSIEVHVVRDSFRTHNERRGSDNDDFVDITADVRRAQSRIRVITARKYFRRGEINSQPRLHDMVCMEHTFVTRSGYVRSEVVVSLIADTSIDNTWNGCMNFTLSLLVVGESDRFFPPPKDLVRSIGKIHVLRYVSTSCSSLIAISDTIHFDAD